MSGNSSVLRVFESRNAVWDVATQSWVAELQPSTSGGGGAITNDGTFAKETGGNLATIATNTPSLVQFASIPSVPVALPDATTILDYVGGTNPIYLGEAATGSATSSAVWQIRKLTYDGNGNPTSILYAGGSPGFTQIYDNRASLSYS